MAETPVRCDGGSRRSDPAPTLPPVSDISPTTIRQGGAGCAFTRSRTTAEDHRPRRQLLGPRPPRSVPQAPHPQRPSGDRARREDTAGPGERGRPPQPRRTGAERGNPDGVRATGPVRQPQGRPKSPAGGGRSEKRGPAGRKTGGKREGAFTRWAEYEENVRRLRRRIFRATQDGDLKKVRNSRKPMLRSRGNTLISVKRVTQQSSGRTTAGTDGERALTPEAGGTLAAGTIRSSKPWKARRSSECSSRRATGNSGHSASLSSVTGSSRTA
ncbi:reverse transcriptase N-terminal domain-containing protein [Streptomyces sp. NPDC001744]|uniref:reverse transcriptase N-terminal domain-containing protein n=1 Tax=Streptomyces sp. NPDC001744 TaxID=3364606 RepID=UPI00369FEECC